MNKIEECNCEFEIIEDHEERKSILDGCCGCHISAPCGFCVTQVSKCIKCGNIKTETF